MTKRQFLLELRDCLERQVGEREIQRHIHYYDEYITAKSSSEDTESQVIEELGDPRWIAKTIIASNDTIDEVPQEKSGKKKIQNGKTKKWVIYIITFFCVISIFLFLFLLLRIFVQLFVPMALVLIIFWIIMLMGKR